MKRSLFKFKLKIVFLSMDNWLEKKRKEKQVVYFKLIAGFIQKIAF